MNFRSLAACGFSALILSLIAAPAYANVHRISGGKNPLATSFEHVQLAQAALRPSPGAGLGQAVRAAPDGATISLRAGRYSGSVRIKGKFLTITGDPAGGSVLDASQAQIAVAVTDGGRLTLSNVTFETRAKDGIAVFVKGGATTVTDCKARSTSKPVFYVEGGSLRIERCQLADLKDSGVVAFQKSDVVVKDTTFSNVARNAIYLADQSSAKVTSSRFENIGGQSVTASKGSTVTVEKSAFVSGKGRGVVISGNSTGRVTGSQFDKLGGVAVLGLKGARVTVTGSRFSDLRNTAIHAEQGGGLTVTDSIISGATGGIVARKGQIAVNLRNNIIENITGKGYAISTRGGGPVDIRGNRIIAVPNGILVSGKLKSPARIVGNTVVNAARRGIAIQETPARGGTAIRDNRIVGAGDSGIFAHKAPKISVTGNLILAKGEYGLFVQNGSSVMLGGNIVAGSKGAVYIHSSAARGSTVGNDILIGAVKPENALKPSSAAARIAYLVKDKETAAALRRQSDAILTGMAAGQGNIADLDRLSSALAASVDRLRAGAKALSSIRVRTFDLLGQPFRAAYLIYDRDGAEVERENLFDPIIFVKPGTYVVQSMLDAKLARDVTVAAGETTITDVRVANSLAFKFASISGKSTIKLPIVLKKRRDMYNAIRASRDTFPHYLVSVPRRDATPAARQNAATLARQRISADEAAMIANSRLFLPLDAIQYGKRSKQQKEDFTKAASQRNTLLNRLVMPLKILAAAGTGADARRLADVAIQAPAYAENLLAVAAYIENRLGALRDGSILSILKNTPGDVSVWAAVYLDYFGIDTGTPTLVRILETASGHPLKGRAARVLVGSRKQSVLRAMRKILVTAVKAQEEKKRSGIPSQAVSAAILHLLTFGDIEDFRRIARLKVSEYVIPLLVLATTDPRPLIDYLKKTMVSESKETSRYFVPQWSRSLADLCPAFRLLPKPDRTRMEKAIQNAFVQVGVRFNLSGRSRNSDIKSSRSYHGTDVSFCRATSHVAAVVFEKNEVFYKGKEWIATPWKSAEFLNSKQYYNISQLDYVANSIVDKEIRKLHPDDSNRALFLAYHAIAKNVEFQKGDSVPGGVDRRAFVLRNPGNPPGAMAGVLDMRPELMDDRIRVSLSFDLASYTQSSLATMMDPPTRSFQNYLRSRGRGLITQVELKRGDRTIPLKAAGEDGRGNFVYEARLDNPGLSGLDLHVQLRMFDTQWSIGFGLYASDYARLLNRSKARLDAVARFAKDRPDDARTLAAWGNALQSMGQLRAADAKYRKIFAIGDTGAKDWFRISDMYAKRAMHAEAAKVLRDAVRAMPRYSDLRIELANQLYRGGDYDAAARTYGALATARPKNLRWKWWQAANQFLAGDHKSANAYFMRADGRYQSRRTTLMRFISARLAGSAEQQAGAATAMRKKLAGREKSLEGNLYRLFLKELEPATVFQAATSPAQQCQAQLFVGYNFLVNANAAEAKKRFRSAVEICSAARLEFRLATAAYTRLQATP